MEEYARNRKAQAERIHDRCRILAGDDLLDRERQAFVDVERELKDQRDEAKRAQGWNPWWPISSPGNGTCGISWP